MVGGPQDQREVRPWERKAATAQTDQAGTELAAGWGVVVVVV